MKTKARLMTRRTGFALLSLLATVGAYEIRAQVTYERLLKAVDEPQNWRTYSGNYSSNRYSTLRQIDPSNVKNIEQKWVYQGQVMGNWQARTSAPLSPNFLRQALKCKDEFFLWLSTLKLDIAHAFRPSRTSGDPPSRRSARAFLGHRSVSNAS